MYIDILFFLFRGNSRIQEGDVGAVVNHHDPNVKVAFKASVSEVRACFPIYTSPLGKVPCSKNIGTHVNLHFVNSMFLGRFGVVSR